MLNLSFRGASVNSSFLVADTRTALFEIMKKNVRVLPEEGVAAEGARRSADESSQVR